MVLIIKSFKDLEYLAVHSDKKIFKLEKFSDKKNSKSQDMKIIPSSISRKVLLYFIGFKLNPERASLINLIINYISKKYRSSRWIERSLSQKNKVHRTPLTKTTTGWNAICQFLLASRWKKDADEKESDQWFISKMHAKPCSFEGGFPNTSFVITSFFYVFACFYWSLFDPTDLDGEVADIILNITDNMTAF